MFWILVWLNFCPSAPSETLSGAVSHRLLHLLCRIAVRVPGGGSEPLMISWSWDADVHGGYKFLVTLDVERRNIEFEGPKIQAIGCIPTQKYSTGAAHPGAECINPHPLRGESECFSCLSPRAQAGIPGSELIVSSFTMAHRDVCGYTLSLQFLDPELGRNESLMTVGAFGLDVVNVLPGGTVSLFDRR